MCGPKVFFSLDVDLKAMIEDAKAKAPAVVRQVFDDFDKDLSDLLSKSLPELRAANARLVTALADTEIRCFTEETGNRDTATSIEAAALAYTVRALQIVIKKRSATSIAGRLSAKRPSTPHAAVAPVARGGTSPSVRGGNKWAATGFSAAATIASKPSTPTKKAGAANTSKANKGSKSAPNVARCERAGLNAAGTDQMQSLSTSVPLAKVSAPKSAKAGAGLGGLMSAGDAFNPCCGDWPSTKNDDRSVHGKSDFDAYFSEPHTLGLDDFDVQELDSFLNMCDSDLAARSDIELC